MSYYGDFAESVAKFCGSVTRVLSNLVNQNNGRTTITPNGIVVDKLPFVVPDPDGKFRRIDAQGRDIPPKNTDYWTEEDFDNYCRNIKDPNKNVMNVIPKIEKAFPDLNLSEKDMRKLVTIVNRYTINIVRLMIDECKLKNLR
jgi:hypothetical protein